MCFDYDCSPTVFNEKHVKARKHYHCCECALFICPGEQHLYIFGVWDSEAATYRICSVCEWFRDRVAQSEMEHGCHAHEAYPAFGCLSEALSEGHDTSIGLIDLDCWHERVEAI